MSGGFLGGADLNLADGLNCFIGGRGAGKTTAFELLRYAIGLLPDPKHQSSRYRAIDNLVRANLSGGRVTAAIRTKTGIAYTAERGVGEEVHVLNERDAPVPVSLDRDQLFSADVFSQSEIEEIAVSPNAQLELLDRFDDGASSAIRRALGEVDRQLKQSGEMLCEIEADLDDAKARASEVVALQERLRGLVSSHGPDADRINAAHAENAIRAREARVFQIMADAVGRFTREIQDSTSVLHSSVDGQVDSTLLAGANADLIDEVRAEFDAFERATQLGLDAISTASRKLLESLRRRRSVLSERHATQEAEYRALLAVSSEEESRAVERNGLHSALAVALEATAQAQELTNRHESALMERKALLSRASELRDQRFALRKLVAEKLTSQVPILRVSVRQTADLGSYRELLIARLKGIGVKQAPTADKLSDNFLPSELASVVRAGDTAALAERCDYDPERARRIIDALAADGGAYDIEAVDLDDQPCIELHDGTKYKESQHLSTGQRCTTILPILLAQSERPLLIDQPEDNLDNAFVYDTIVRALRDTKGSRQVIVVTHNPNIPVLGEAERVFVFASDGAHAQVQKAGTVDECKDDIERILEGGRDAFLERKLRYGH